jgi:hypothetical protein
MKSEVFEWIMYSALVICIAAAILVFTKPPDIRVVEMGSTTCYIYRESVSCVK